MATHKQIVTSGDQNGAIRRHGNKVSRKVYCPSGFTKYHPLVIREDVTTWSHFATVAAASDTLREVCVSEADTTTAAGWYWMQIEGPATAFVDGNADIAAGALIELTANTTTSFILDHATDCSTRSAAKLPTACATNATNTTMTVHLRGIKVSIGSS